MRAGVRRRPPTPAPKWHPRRPRAETGWSRAPLFGVQDLDREGKTGAGEGIRTLDPNLGKVVPVAVLVFHNALDRRADRLPNRCPIVSSIEAIEFAQGWTTNDAAARIQFHPFVLVAVVALSSRGDPCRPAPRLAFRLCSMRNSRCIGRSPAGGCDGSSSGCRPRPLRRATLHNSPAALSRGGGGVARASSPLGLTDFDLLAALVYICALVVVGSVGPVLPTSYETLDASLTHREIGPSPG